MKKSTQILALCLLYAFVQTSCKKEPKEETIAPTDPVNEQVLQILPQYFIDSLANHGFVFNGGNTPPNMQHIYTFTPVNNYDNSNTFSPGQSALLAKFQIANQNNTNADVYFRMAFNMGIDTSSARIITGQGNNFTIYAQAHGDSNGKYVYDYVLSGKLTPNGIENLMFAFVMLSNQSPTLTGAGTIRIFHAKENPVTTCAVLRNALPTTLQLNESVMSSMINN